MVQNDGSAMVSIHEQSEYHLKDLIMFEFYPCSEDQLKLHISFTVLSLKHRLSICESRLQDVLTHLKHRCKQS
jgi:hypothetical protein